MSSIKVLRLQFKYQAIAMSSINLLLLLRAKPKAKKSKPESSIVACGIPGCARDHKVFANYSHCWVLRGNGWNERLKYEGLSCFYE